MIVWQFIRKHLITSVLMVFGVLINVGSRINDVYSLINAHLPTSVWEAIGAVIFFGSVIALLISWHKANEQANQQVNQRANLVGVVPAAITTGIRLQITAGTGNAVALDSANIWRWYLFRQLGPNVAKKGQPPVQHITSTMLFLLFDKPVAIKQFLVNAGSTALPRYEVKDRSPRHAIIYFMGAIPPATILEIRAQT